MRPHQALDNAIYVANADASGERLLAATAGIDPAWSPDGGRIAFSDGRDLYAIRADGTGVTPLTSGAPTDVSPSWSPDGASIAFQRDDGIWVMDADERDPRALGLRGHTPRFSPDGKRLAFERGGVVWIVRADGTGPEQGVSPPELWAYGPAWSPDGTRLAFNAGGAVCTARADGTDAKRVTFDNQGLSFGWIRPGARLAAVAISLERRRALLVRRFSELGHRPYH